MQTIQEFIGELERYEKAGYDKRRTIMNLMFYPNISEAKRSSLKRWDILFFKENEDVSLGTSYGLRIVPNMPYKEWPVYCIFRQSDGLIYNKNKEDLLAYAVFRQLKNTAIKDKYSFPEIFYGEEGEALLSIFGGREKRDMVIENYATMYDKDYEGHRQKEIELLLQLDPSASHQLYRQAYQRLIDEEGYLPIEELKQVKFPYRDRLLKSIARKVDIDTKLNREMISMLWEAFSTTVHGLDMDRPGFNQGLCDDAPTSSDMGIIILYMLLEEELISEEIKSHPLYDAAIKLETNSMAYNGSLHALGAALLDEQYHDPIGCFNALASGSYWAASQGRDVTLYAKAALVVCEQNNWHDTAYAIEYQIRKYEDGK